MNNITKEEMRILFIITAKFFSVHKEGARLRDIVELSHLTGIKALYIKKGFEAWLHIDKSYWDWYGEKLEIDITAKSPVFVAWYVDFKASVEAYERLMDDFKHPYED